MNGIEELAKLFKERENNNEFAPIVGTIVSLPDLKIRRDKNIVLSAIHITSVIDLYQKDEAGDYINMNKDVVLLPYNKDNKYILIGVVHNA